MRSLLTFVFGMVVGGVTTVAAGAWLFRESLDELDSFLGGLVGDEPASEAEAIDIPFTTEGEEIEDQPTVTVVDDDDAPTVEIVDEDPAG